MKRNEKDGVAKTDTRKGIWAHLRREKEGGEKERVQMIAC